MEQVPPTTVQAIRDMLDEFHQLIAAARLYGHEHPKTLRSAERMSSEVARLLKETGELEFTVQRDALVWLDHEAYQDDDNRDGIARTLHREGIVRFAFLPGLHRPEILLFAELLGVNLGLPQWEEETLTSLLWQAQLQAVSYEAVEYLSDAQEMSETTARGEEGYIHEMVRQILDPDPPAPGEGFGGMGAALGKAGTGSGPGGRPRAGGDGPAGPGGTGPGGTAASPHGTGAPATAAGSQPMQGIPVDMDATEAAGVGDARSDLSVPDESWTPAQHIAALDLGRWAEEADGELQEEVDFKNIRREVAEDSHETILGRVVSLLLVAGARGREELDTEQATALVTRALTREEAEESHLWKATVELAMRLTSSPVELIQPGRFGLEAWLDTLTRPGLFTAFAATLSRDNPADVQLLHRFLGGGSGERARLVVQRMGGQGGQRLGWVMDEVARVVQRDMARITDGLHRRSVEEVLQIIDLLARMGGNQATATLQELLQHRISDVRAAAIKALPDPLPRPLVEPVMALLSDDNAAVREAVIELLRTRRPVGAFDALKSMMTGEAFTSGDAERKRVIAAALAASGGEAAIPVLQEIIGQFGLFTGAKAKADLEASARALALIDSLRSRQVLKNAGKSLNPYVRRICREALEGGAR